MSGPEIKHALRKTEFPLCVREALHKMVQLICGRVPSIKHMDLALDLVAEFIFCETDRRGNKRPEPLKPLLELQLLEVLFEYFNSTATEAAKNTIFLSLFSGPTATQRLPVLIKLVSIAIGTGSSSVLIAASAWMQQLGNTSSNSCKLAEAIVTDYFVLVPCTSERLRTLPSIAPQFIANLLTAVAEIFYASGKLDSLLLPQETLLKMITYWVRENHKLCIAAQQNQPALPPGAIAMEATTPLVGLLKWCILGPLYNQHSDLYSELHLALLHSLLEIPPVNPPRAITAQHLSPLCGNIIRYITDMHNRNRDLVGYDKIQAIKDDCNLQLALDRYAQAIQVALFVNCIYGNVDDLINQLCQLPQTKLIQIIINTYQSK